MGCLPLGNFYLTGYGRRLQINAMPSEIYTPQEQFALSNTFNPAYWMNNLMALYSGNLAQMGVGQYAGAYQAGQQLGQQAADSISINTSSGMLQNNINSLKADLEQALNSDKLNDEQKTALRQQKQRVEELQQKLEDIRVLQQQGATTEQIKTALSQLSQEYRDLRNEVQAFADKIKQELEAGNNAGNTGNTGNTGNAGGSGDAGNTGNAGGSGDTGNTAETGNTGNASGSSNTSTNGLNANVDDFTNFNSPYQGEIVFFIPTLRGGVCTCRAAFTDKRGIKHTFTADGSGRYFIFPFDTNHCRRYMADKIRQQILDAGFTNVTLSNPNGYAF